MVKKDYDKKRKLETLSLEELKVEYEEITDMDRKIAISMEAYQARNGAGIVLEEEKEMQEKLVKLIEEHEKFKLDLENLIRNNGNLLIN